MVERVYYSISEVSELAGVSYSKLHYWESVIPQLQPRTNGTPRRFYTPEDLRLVQNIKYLREELHLPISAIVKRLDNDMAGVDTKQKQIERLNKIREELVALRKLM